MNGMAELSPLNTNFKNMFVTIQTCFFLYNIKESENAKNISNCWTNCYW